MEVVDSLISRHTYIEHTTNTLNRTDRQHKTRSTTLRALLVGPYIEGLKT